MSAIHQRPGALLPSPRQVAVLLLGHFRRQARRAIALLHRTGGWYGRAFSHSKEGIELQTGDIFVRETGGGGYGDPLERDPQMVADDVLDCKISERSAEEDYGVALSDDGFGCDEASTKQRRAWMAQERRPVDRLFDSGEEGIL